MKIIFFDATELEVQQVYTDGEELKIKVIGKTAEELRSIFEDQMKTERMIVKEQERTIATYDGYKNYKGTFCYTGGILEPCLYKIGNTPEERLEYCENNIKNLQDNIDMAIAELTIAIASQGGM